MPRPDIEKIRIKREHTRTEIMSLLDYIAELEAERDELLQNHKRVSIGYHDCGGNPDPDLLRMEAIHIAAMGVRFLIDICRTRSLPVGPV